MDGGMPRRWERRATASPMSRRLFAFFLFALPLARAAAQDRTFVVDSIAVSGNTRLTRSQVIGTSAILVGQPINYRDVQRAITTLFETGQFDDVTVEQSSVGQRLVLSILVKERPLMDRWAVRGVEKLAEGPVKGRVKLTDNRPLDRPAIERARASIDSLYKKEGYYAARVAVHEVPQASGAVRVVFDVSEGSRVAIGQVVIQGNQHYPDQAVVNQMSSKPEGFWWFQKGKYDEQAVQQDIRERLPRWYASRGYLDFQVTGDSLVPDSVSGKAVLVLTVDEGRQYQVGHFEVDGNRRFSVDEVMPYFPFGPVGADGLPADKATPFNRAAWETATGKLQELYANYGYMYARVIPEENRRTMPDGTPVVDLRWTVREGTPVTVNKVDIVGNDVTHERVIREAIVLLPGDLLRRDALIRSYQNVSNLNFFQQPLPTPDTRPAASCGNDPECPDLDVVFKVEEKHTGNINFGASLGEGTGVGGFLGLEEPNLFGRAKQGSLRWQFGKNIQDFTLSFTDPAIRESRISGTLSLFDSRARYTVGDLGRRRQTGGSMRLGFPFLGSRYTRLYGSYSFQRIRYTEGSVDLRARFNCNNCTRSTLGTSLLRDTRIGLPFPVGGTYTSAGLEVNGGVLGGTGNYRKLDFEGRWYAPLGSLGGNGQFGGGIRFVLGLTAKSGFIFGDAGPFFTELYTLGGVQFGVPLRGYDEFSITPNGYDPSASSNQASPDAFGKSFASFSVEAGARISQALYVSTFLDAGNVYRDARQWDPTRLFRGAGFGAAVISPLGPIGIDVGYGFDRVDAFGKPTPGWQLHFKLGNFF